MLSRRTCNAVTLFKCWNLTSLRLELPRIEVTALITEMLCLF